MCIRDRAVAAAISLFGFESGAALATVVGVLIEVPAMLLVCLLYTSDAADERSSVDLGGRRIIKKKKEYNARRYRQ